MIKLAPHKYLGRRRVLVICATEEATQRVAGIVTAAEYEAFTTTSAPMGLLTAVERAPDVIVCDAEMPGLSGASIVKLLQQHRAVSSIPLILITGEMAILAPGATMTLPMRYTREQLLRAVEHCIEKRVQAVFGQALDVWPTIARKGGKAA
jgi:CheY-like chemotaxis protein